MKIEPNSPAFPDHGVGLFHEPITVAKGMTYRQWLVGQIINGYCSNADWLRAAKHTAEERNLKFKDAFGGSCVAASRRHHRGSQRGG